MNNLIIKHAQDFLSVEDAIENYADIVLGVDVQLFNWRHIEYIGRVFNMSPMENYISEYMLKASPEGVLLCINIGLGTRIEIGIVDIDLSTLESLKIFAKQNNLGAIYSSKLNKFLVVHDNKNSDRYTKAYLRNVNNDFCQIYLPTLALTLNDNEKAVGEREINVNTKYDEFVNDSSHSYEEIDLHLTSEADLVIESTFFTLNGFKGTLAVFETLKKALCFSDMNFQPKSSIEPYLRNPRRFLFNLESPSIFDLKKIKFTYDAENKCDRITMVNNQGKSFVNCAKTEYLGNMIDENWTCYYLPCWTFIVNADGFFEYVYIKDKIFFFKNKSLPFFPELVFPE